MRKVFFYCKTRQEEDCILCFLINWRGIIATIFIIKTNFYMRVSMTTARE